MYPNITPRPIVVKIPSIVVILIVEVDVPSNGGRKCQKVKNKEVNISQIHFPIDF